MPVDKTGECPRWSGTPYYDDFYALWDTYRTSMPLFMEYYPERATDIVRALLAIYRHEGYMPDARSGDCNGRTQGGSHADVVIAEAYARGLKGIDYREALQAMLKDGDVPPADDEKEGRGGLREYIRLGYVPYGIPRAGTRTVEYSYDDWCIAQVAKGLGKHAIYNRYMRRSRSWQNLWRKGMPVAAGLTRWSGAVPGSTVRRSLISPTRRWHRGISLGGTRFSTRACRPNTR